jgi:hypothetical protein
MTHVPRKPTLFQPYSEIIIYDSPYFNIMSHKRINHRSTIAQRHPSNQGQLSAIDTCLKYPLSSNVVDFLFMSKLQAENKAILKG